MAFSGVVSCLYTSGLVLILLFLLFFFGRGYQVLLMTIKRDLAVTMIPMSVQDGVELSLVFAFNSSSSFCRTHLGCLGSFITHHIFYHQIIHHHIFYRCIFYHHIFYHYIFYHCIFYHCIFASLHLYHRIFYRRILYRRILYHCIFSPHLL